VKNLKKPEIACGKKRKMSKKIVYYNNTLLGKGQTTNHIPEKFIQIWVS
jgi:hypothetical protein